MLKSYRSRFASIALMAAVSLSMAACNSSSAPPGASYTTAPAATAAPAQTTAAAPAPVIIQQAAAPHDRSGDLLLGAVAGGLATHMLTNSRPAPPAPAATPPATINKTVIHKTMIVQAPPPKPAPDSRPALATPSARPTVSLAKSPSYSGSSVSYRPATSYASTTTRVSYSPSVLSTARR